MSTQQQKTGEITDIAAKYIQACKLIEGMVPIERACRAVGLSRNTFYWLKKKENGGTARTDTPEVTSDENTGATNDAIVPAPDRKTGT